MAFKIKTAQPAQHHILLILANHADQYGGSFPSYSQIMEETSYGSKQTVASALGYPRDELKVLTWQRGWGNEHASQSNSYRLCAVIDECGALSRRTLKPQQSQRTCPICVHPSAHRNTLDACARTRPQPTRPILVECSSLAGLLVSRECQSNRHGQCLA